MQTTHSPEWTEGFGAGLRAAAAGLTGGNLGARGGGAQASNGASTTATKPKRAYSRGGSKAQHAQAAHLGGEATATKRATGRKKMTTGGATQQAQS